MLLYKFPSGPLGTNALLIGCNKTKKGAVVDPSLGSTAAILQKAEGDGLHIEKILLTHSHWDHFADAHEMKAKTGALLYVHALDAKNVERPGSDGLPLLLSIPGVKPDHLLQEGDRVAVGELSFEVLHTPGHCPGCVCFYCREQKLLISGDTLFRGSMGSLSLPTAEPDKMWESLTKLSKLPPDTRVIPGHGGETTIGGESWLSRAKELFSD